MATKLVQTGVTFPDTTTQTTAAVAWPTQRVIFAFGDTGTVTNISNQVNSYGIVSADITGVGSTSRSQPFSATYAGNRAIMAWGTSDYSNGVAYSNLITDAGVVGTDNSTVGTVRWAGAGNSYGGNKAIFGLGLLSGGGGSKTGVSNLISSYGVIASDTTAVAIARFGVASAPYGGDKGFWSGGAVSLTTATSWVNFISNTGVVSSDDSLFALSYSACATSYGVDKALIAYDPAFGNFLWFTTVSNTGTHIDTGATVGTNGTSGRGAGYGGDKGILGFMYRGSVGGYSNRTNLISNVGVMAADVTNIGTARYGAGAASFG
jgi:hypothetical protein